MHEVQRFLTIRYILGKSWNFPCYMWLFVQCSQRLSNSLCFRSWTRLNQPAPSLFRSTLIISPI